MLVLKQLGDPLETETLVKARPPPVPALKKRCAHFNKQLCESDPLLCPQCVGATRIIAFLDQAAVIEKMLTYPGLRPAHAHSPFGPIAASPDSGIPALQPSAA